eukprot:TRINITY_DN110346_c0_g1_i1.p1 TRINITY_DN110346_c0_g1~~TRINITY_DN110346_c0_g1_i1.p1  ORF type:complete len:838 (+),score=173.24 TRINITY_DN110346_c0_g1_i1:175-2688(+)
MRESTIDEICSLLVSRGLPTWLLQYLQAGLEARQLPAASEALDMATGTERKVSDLFLGLTCADLATMGIAHPLHRRRLLREVDCLFSGQQSPPAAELEQSPAALKACREGQESQEAAGMTTGPPDEAVALQPQSQQEEQQLQQFCMANALKLQLQAKRPQSAPLSRRGQPPRPTSATSPAKRHSTALRQRPASATWQRPSPAEAQFQGEKLHCASTTSSSTRPGSAPWRRQGHIVDSFQDVTPSRPSSAGSSCWRWPYLDNSTTDSASGKLQVSPQSSRKRPSSAPSRRREAGPQSQKRVSINHARWRWLRAGGFPVRVANAKEIENLPDHIKELLRSEPGTRLPHEKTWSRKPFIPTLEMAHKDGLDAEMTTSDGACEAREGVSRQESQEGWEDWLQSRLHPSGSMAIVEEALRAAASGNLEELRRMIVKITAHGEEFMESIDVTPLPSQLESKFGSAAPPGTVPPRGVMAWLRWRKELLEEAEQRLSKFLDQFVSLLQQISVMLTKTPDSLQKTQHTSQKRMFRQAMAKAKARRGLNQENTSEKTALATASETSQTNGNEAEQPTSSQSQQRWKLLRSSFRAILLGKESAMASKKNAKEFCWQEVLDEKEEVPPPQQDSLAGGLKDLKNCTPLEKFRKAAFHVWWHVRVRREEKSFSNVKLLRCVAMQSVVKELKGELRLALKAVEIWPGLQSQTFKDCKRYLAETDKVHKLLFETFKDVRKMTEISLRCAMSGRIDEVDYFELRYRIIDMQRELGSRILLGDHAIKAAEKAGVGLKNVDLSEPPNPWEGDVDIWPPPWEATFTKALKCLEHHREHRHVAPESSPPSDAGGVHGS